MHRVIQPHRWRQRQRHQLAGKADDSVFASVAAVISAIAADASRGVSDKPATRPIDIDPDTSSASV